MIFLFLLLPFLYKCEPPILKQEFSSLSGLIHINFYVGNKSRFFLIELEKNFTHISDSNYEQYNSSMLKVITKDTKVSVNHNPIEADIVSERFQFLTEPFILETHLTFYYTSSKRLVSSDSLGMAYQFDNEDYSLIHRLYKEKKIKEKVFGFEYKAQNKGYLYFGGIPKEITEKKYKAYCPVSDESNDWNCKMKRITIGNNYYEFDGEGDIFFFETGQNRISAPGRFINYMKRELFKPYFDKKECTRIDTSVGTITVRIECKKYAIETFPSFNFEINGFLFTLTKDDLFDCTDTICVLNINQNIVWEEKWVFGNCFLSKYITLFDYGNKQITFFSDRVIKAEITVYIKGISSINIILMMVFMLFNIYHIIKKTQD